MKWYYYLHENGELIGKNPIAYNQADFYESPFVKCYWLIDTENRKDAWLLVIEALERGANISKIKELSNKWGLTETDLKNFIINHQKPSKEQINGMDKFITLILRVEPKKFWESIK